MIKRRISIPILRLLACTLVLLTLSACNQEKRLMEHFPEWVDLQRELSELETK